MDFSCKLLGKQSKRRQRLGDKDGELLLGTFVAYVSVCCTSRHALEVKAANLMRRAAVWHCTADELARCWQAGRQAGRRAGMH